MIHEKLIRKKEIHRETVYIAALTTSQLFHLGKSREFSHILDDLSTDLAAADPGSFESWERVGFKSRIASLLGGYILTGNFESFQRVYRYYCSYNDFDFQNCELAAYQLALGKSDKIPEDMDSRFLPYLFPFMSWNSVIRGGSPHSLLAAYGHLFGDKIPDKFLEDYVLFLLWHGRKKELQACSNAFAERKAAKDLVDATYAILEGDLETAADYYSRRYLFLKRELKDNFTYYNPLFLITIELLFLFSEKKATLIHEIGYHIHTSKNLEYLNDCACAISNLFDQMESSVFTPSKSDEDVTLNECPSRVPLFQIMLSMLPYSLMKTYVKVTTTALSGYKRTAEVLINQDQRYTACCLLCSIANLTDNGSPEREQAQEYCKKYGLAPLVPIADRRSRWKIMLEDFEDNVACILSSSGNNKYDRDKFISWHLRTKSMNNSHFHGYQLFFIEPVQHLKNRNGVFSKGRALNLNRLATGDYDDILDEQEILIRRNMKDDFGRFYVPVTSISFLEHNSAVYLDNDTEPITLKPGRNTIDTNFDLQTKHLTLSVRYPFDRFSEEDVVYLYPDPEESHVYYYIMQTPIQKKLAEFFGKYSDTGSVCFPMEAVASLTRILEPLSEQITIEGDLVEHLHSDLPEIAGEIHLCMRMQQEGSDITFELKNRLHEQYKRPVIPGIGAQKIAGFLNEQRVLFFRDLAAERAAAVKLTEDCPDLQMSENDHWAYESYDLAEALRILSRLKELGIDLEWAKDGGMTVLPPIDTGAIRFKSDGTGADEWFTVGGDIKVDQDRVLQLSELLQRLPQRIGEFIQLDDRTYLQVTRKLLHQLDALQTASVVRNKKIQLLPAALPMLDHVFDNGMGAFLEKHFEKVREAFRLVPEVPERFQGMLRPYQYEGYTYLVRMAECHIGCCLADDMGLGKTVQLLALLLRNAENGASLIVAPASVCHNWQAEAARFTPSLNVTVLGNKDRKKVIRNAGSGDIVIASYGLVLSEMDHFCSREWNIAVLDEAQSIKNHTAKRSQAVKQLRANVRIAATGTPIENRLPELWSIFDFLNPGLLGNETEFERKFSNSDTGLSALKKLVSPLILRRMKKDVLDDLPEKQEITIPVELPDGERELYEAMRRHAVDEIRAGKGGNRISVLAQLTKLRRVCCHPRLVNPELDFAGAKMQRIMELVRDLYAGGHRALIFSQYVDFLALLRTEMEQENFTYQYLDGSTPSGERLELVDAFQHGKGDFFLISLKAGGTGLNLTAANYVILADPWWNPAVEDQAADRVYRIGQKNSVTVYRMVTSGTVEEKVIALHQRKRHLADDILSEAGQSAVTMDELLHLFDE
ncbi:MAG: DEAD/DEAH box helicase [Lentisphaeria bacterium]|nr:DEAD/DEAH box helicase [Lentisphaeria bacterium]